MTAGPHVLNYPKAVIMFFVSVLAQIYFYFIKNCAFHETQKCFTEKKAEKNENIGNK